VQRVKKIDIDRMRVNGSWRYWTEILKEKEEREVISEKRERVKEREEKRRM